MAATRGKRLELCLEIMNRRGPESDYGRDQFVNYQIANEMMVAVNELMATWQKQERWTVAQARAQMKRYIIDKDPHGVQWYRPLLAEPDKWVTKKHEMKFKRPAHEPRPERGVTMPSPEKEAASKAKKESAVLTKTKMSGEELQKFREAASRAKARTAVAAKAVAAAKTERGVVMGDQRSKAETTVS